MVNYTCKDDSAAAYAAGVQQGLKMTTVTKRKSPKKKKSAKKASPKKQPTIAQQIKELKKMTTVLKKKPFASPKPRISKKTGLPSNRGRSQIDPKMALWNQKLAWWRETHRLADGSLPPLRKAMQACKGKGANPHKSPCRGKKYTMPAMPEGFKYTPKKRPAKKKSAKKASAKKAPKKQTKQQKQKREKLANPENQRLLNELLKRMK